MFSQVPILIYGLNFTHEKAGAIKSEIEFLTEEKVELIEFSKSNIYKINAQTTIYALLNDNELKILIESLKNIKSKIVILPNDKNPLAKETFKIPESLKEAISLTKKDSVYLLNEQVVCNGELVLGSVFIGFINFLKAKNKEELLNLATKGLFNMKLLPINITTEKGKNFTTAALLIECGIEDFIYNNRKYFFKNSSNQCKRVSSIIYAPQSILEAIKLKLMLLRKKFRSHDSLPAGVGTIKSEKIIYKSSNNKPLKIFINGNEKESKEVIIEAKLFQVEIVTGWSNCSNNTEKESIRTQNLPQESDIVNFLGKKRLPLVTIASEDSFAELFQKLRDSAKFSSGYMLFLLLSVLMATTGLFQNSSPVIIGAMILAPLMAPIVALSMGAIRFEESLLKNSVKTLILSVLLSLTASALYAWALPFTHLTEQMSMRTHPTLLDLAVAVFSGIAAAYGYSNSKVGESLAGVAIAVALVPPLCVAGIGIGWGSLAIFSNAFLLFLTNIAGIIIAAGATFYIIGYASTKYASTAFFLKLLMVALISAPLYLSTQTLLEDERIFKTFSKSDTLTVDGIKVKVVVLGIAHDSYKKYAKLNVISNKELSPYQKEEIARLIKDRLGEDVGVMINFGYRY